MGLLDLLSSDYQCDICGSWNTRTRKFADLESYRQEQFWDFTEKGSISPMSVPKGCYKCNSCGAVVIRYKDENGGTGTIRWES